MNFAYPAMQPSSQNEVLAPFLAHHPIVGGKADSETGSCSSEEAEEGMDISYMIGNDGEDDEDSYCSSSDDSSLGEEIRRAEAAGTFSMPMLCVERQRSRSLPNVMNMTMMLGSDESGDVSSALTNSQDQQALNAFMARMQNSTSYFQAPIAGGQGPSNSRTSITATSAAAPTNMASGRVRSTGALQDLVKNTNSTDRECPNIRLQEMLKSRAIQAPKKDAAYWEAYFLPVSPTRIQAYAPPVVAAMRGEDLPTLRQTVQEAGPGSMEACNQQGETLLHLACRRRNRDLVHFLVEEAGVSVKVRDDWNKTAMHELCWSSQPNNPAQFEAFQLLFKKAPELLFAKDKRGFLPLQYVPKDAWADWCVFLEKNKASILSTVMLMMDVN